MRNLIFGLLVVMFSVFLISGCAKKTVVTAGEPVVPGVTAGPEAPPRTVPESPTQTAPEKTEVVEEQVVTPVPAQTAVPADTAQKTTLETIHFDFDRSDLRKHDRDILTRNGRLIMDELKGNVQIEGHCDERGSAEYNLALGERRARSVMNYLVTLGVPAGRLSIISYGEEKPADSGHEEVSWVKNRRVEFVIR